MPLYTSIDGVKKKLISFYESIDGTKRETITKYAGYEGEKRIIFSKRGIGYIKFMIATTDGIYYTTGGIKWVKLISDTITNAYIDGIYLTTGERKWVISTYYKTEASSYNCRVYLIDELDSNTPTVTTLSSEDNLGSYKYSNPLMTENCIWTSNKSQLIAFKYDGTSFTVTPNDSSGNALTNMYMVSLSSHVYALQWVNGTPSSDSTKGFAIYSYPLEEAGTSVLSLLASRPDNLSKVTKVYNLSGTAITSDNWGYTTTDSKLGTIVYGGDITYLSPDFKFFGGKLYTRISAKIAKSSSTSYKLYGVMEISFDGTTLSTRVFIEPNKTTSYADYSVSSLKDVNDSGIFYTRGNGNLYYKADMDSAEVQLSWGFTPSFLETSLENSPIAITPPYSYLPDSDVLSENTVWTGRDITAYVGGTIKKLGTSHLSGSGTGFKSFLHFAIGTEILVNESGTYVPYIKVGSKTLIRKYTTSATYKPYVYMRSGSYQPYDATDKNEAGYIKNQISDTVLSFAYGTGANINDYNSYLSIAGVPDRDHWLFEIDSGDRYDDPVTVYYVNTSGSIKSISAVPHSTMSGNYTYVPVSEKSIRPLLVLSNNGVYMEENEDGTVKFKGD